MALKASTNDTVAGCVCILTQSEFYDDRNDTSFMFTSYLWPMHTALSHMIWDIQFASNSSYSPWEKAVAVTPAWA